VLVQLLLAHHPPLHYCTAGIIGAAVVVGALAREATARSDLSGPLRKGGLWIRRKGRLWIRRKGRLWIRRKGRLWIRRKGRLWIWILLWLLTAPRHPPPERMLEGPQGCSQHQGYSQHHRCGLLDQS
jgi:hypothetical protein